MFSVTKTSEQFYTELGHRGLSGRKTSAHTRRELSFITSLLRKNQRILDLGCGYGRFTIPLARRGYCVEGMDITPLLLKNAARIARNRKTDVKFMMGDMRKLPYRNSSFDVVICMWSAFSEIVETDEQIQAIREIHRVLRSGGFALIETHNSKKSGIAKPQKINGISMMPMYNHTRSSLSELAEKANVETYKAFTAPLGGRNRLFLQFWS